MVSGNYRVSIDGTAALKQSSTAFRVIDCCSSPRSSIASHEAVRHVSSHKALMLRVFIASCIVFLVSLGFVITHAGVLETNSSLSNSATEIVRVHSGDTIWSIAENHPIDNVTTNDVADYIIEINELDGGLIHPGQTICVPASH